MVRQWAPQAYNETRVLTRNHAAGPHRQNLVSNLQPAILVGSTSFDDLCYVDAIIARDVLVPYAPCNAEAKSWMAGGEKWLPMGLGSKPWRQGEAGWWGGDWR